MRTAIFIVILALTIPLLPSYAHAQMFNDSGNSIFADIQGDIIVNNNGAGSNLNTNIASMSGNIGHGNQVNASINSHILVENTGSNAVMETNIASITNKSNRAVNNVKIDVIINGNIIHRNNQSGRRSTLNIGSFVR